MKKDDVPSTISPCTVWSITFLCGKNEIKHQQISFDILMFPPFAVWPEVMMNYLWPMSPYLCAGSQLGGNIVWSGFDGPAPVVDALLSVHCKCKKEIGEKRKLCGKRARNSVVLLFFLWRGRLLLCQTLCVLWCVSAVTASPQFTFNAVLTASYLITAWGDVCCFFS